MTLILPVPCGFSVVRAGPGSVLCRLVLKKRTDPVQPAASAPAVAAPPAAVRVQAQVFWKGLVGPEVRSTAWEFVMNSVVSLGLDPFLF